MRIGWFIIGFVSGTLFGSLVTKIIIAKFFGGWI